MYSQRAEFNISLNRHVKCTLKSNRMSISFWNHQTFYFQDCWGLVRNSWSVCRILSLLALRQSGFWAVLWTYCKLKMSTLFRFYKYFTNYVNTKYLLVNNLPLSDILVESWFWFSPAEPLNPNQLGKFNGFWKKVNLFCQSHVIKNSLLHFSKFLTMLSVSKVSTPSPSQVNQCFFFG